MRIVWRLQSDAVMWALGIVEEDEAFYLLQSLLIRLKAFHVEVAAVLDAAVGVMDKSGEVTSSSLFYGHAEGFEREDGS